MAHKLLAFGSGAAVLLLVSQLIAFPRPLAANWPEEDKSNEEQSENAVDNNKGDKGGAGGETFFGDKEREMLLRKVLRQSGFNTDEEIDEVSKYL
jgi:hypothetical protein